MYVYCLHNLTACLLLKHIRITLFIVIQTGTEFGWNIQSGTDRKREIYWLSRTQFCNQDQYEVIDNMTVNGARAAGSCMKNCQYKNMRQSSASEQNLWLSSYNLSYLTRDFTYCFICWMSNQIWDWKIDLVATAGTTEPVFAQTDSVKKCNLRLDLTVPTWQGIFSTKRAARYWPVRAENPHFELRKGITHRTNFK